MSKIPRRGSTMYPAVITILRLVGGSVLNPILVAGSSMMALKFLDTMSKLWKGSAKHIFSKDHIKNGIMRLGGSQEAIFNKIYKDVNSNLANAVNGSNQIHTTINGVKTTKRFYVSNGEVQSINARMTASDLAKVNNHAGAPHLNFETLAPNPLKPGKFGITGRSHIFIFD